MKKSKGRRWELSDSPFNPGFIPETNEASARIIIRDNEGRVMLPAFKSLGPLSHMDLAEGCAVQTGISLSLEMDFRSLIVETDSLQVHHLLYSEVEDIYELGRLFFTLKNGLLRSCVYFFSLLTLERELLIR